MYPATDASSMPGPTFEVVLVEPEIPNNTGNIGRTAAATGSRLHVIHPIGFDMDEKARRRAGLDYWEHLDCQEHAGWDEFLASQQPSRIWLCTTKAEQPPWKAGFKRGDYLLFGNETSGVPDALHDWFIDEHGHGSRLGLPLRPEARSLNLATAVCAVVYEGLRQLEG